VSRLDLGTSSAVGLIERTGAPPADGDDPAPARHITAVITAPLALGLDRVRTALGITEEGSPKGQNWQVLRQPGFSWYFSGSVVSNFGTWLQNTAQVVLAYQLTHSVFWVGLVTSAQFTSPLVLGAWAGVLTHKLGNWRTLIITQCASMLIALTLAGLEFDHSLTRYGLVAGALLIGLAFTFALPALSVTVATLVPPTETKRALAMDSVSYNLGRALAPVSAVLIFTRIGFGWAFGLNAISYGFFTVVLLCLRRRQARTAGQNKDKRSRVGNGFRIAWNDRRIMVLLLMVAAVTVAADPFLVLGPALARSFGSSADWSGLFITALGAGNVIGSFRPSRQVPSIRRGATMLAILSLAVIVFVAAPWIGISVAAAFAAGVSCLIAGATTRALLLYHAGPEHQAAVMAAWAVAWAGSKPLASFADGTLATYFCLQTTGILLALPALVPALVLLLWPTAGKRLVRQLSFGTAS
jgi:predicted MFS family arabinose efflux permease